jgi:hypothetical protein
LRSRRPTLLALHRLANESLIAELVPLLRDLPWSIAVDDCEEHDGDLRLAVFAQDLGRDVAKGDQVLAGFFLQNSEQGRFESVATTRVFRVVCENGAIMDCEEGRTTNFSARENWRQQLAQVVEHSFDGEGLDRDTARFRKTTEDMLMTPYELLCNLVAQEIISEDEQLAIQSEFDDVGDYTLYGIVNAVTRIAAHCRESDDWKRSFELERLGGEIVRGDHQLPTMGFAYR